MIQCISPLRISFMGGRTDFPAFYKEEEGFVVATTIDKYIHVQINDAKGVHLRQTESETAAYAADLKNGIVREVLKFYKINTDIEIKAQSDTPSGTGLGSSSSFTVALLKALGEKQNKNLNAEDLAELASLIEIEKLGINTGKQDQYAAAFGGMNAFQFLPDGKVKVLPIELTESEKLQKNLVVYYTGISRIGSQILEVERSTFESTREALLGMRNLAKDFYHELRNGADLRCLGEILDEGWHLKKGINDLISNQVIEDAYQAALRAGAYGGKLLGAGGGGFLLFVCPQEKQENLQKALAGLKALPIKFSTEGAKLV